MILGLAAMVSLVGFYRPSWIRLPNRWAVAGVFVGLVILANIAVPETVQDRQAREKQQAWEEFVGREQEKARREEAERKGQPLSTIQTTDNPSEVSEERFHQEPEAQPNEKLDESTRKRFFYELTQVQDRALKEAEKRYPTNPSMTPDWRENVDRQIDAERSLSAKYEAELRQEYGISEEEQRRIMVEGVKKDWPMPSL